ncbi:kinase-like domain-containing protein [Rhizoctonia solani]|nr:kinase-like domain-containing protein [Rhizoctonia solani]
MDTRQDTAMIVSGGGFGDIWMSRLHNGTKVAIKAWRTNTIEGVSHKTLKRAARELHYWSRMEHPNIHQLMGVILFRDQYLGMVSEWMENENLHEYLRKQPDANRYQLANVLVSSDGVARLSDFDHSIMSEAPEMLCEQPRKPTESDVYALAMTMLEIFTGNVPYPECRREYAVIKKIESGTLPTRPIEQLGEDYKGDLMWQLLLTCWNKNPSDRPSAGQVSDSLESNIHKA